MLNIMYRYKQQQQKGILYKGNHYHQRWECITFDAFFSTSRRSNESRDKIECNGLIALVIIKET